MLLLFPEMIITCSYNTHIALVLLAVPLAVPFAILQSGREYLQFLLEYLYVELE